MKKRQSYLFAFLLIGAIPLLVPVKTQAASFDCAKATTKIDKLICTDGELSKLDEEMARFYRQAKAELNDAPWFVEQQRLWLNHRNVCEDRDCIETSYHQRLDGMRWYVEIEKDPEDTIVGKLPHDTYRYELDVDNNPTVCRHMEKVYNAYFRQPWVTHRFGSKAYEPGGFYSYPKYAGVEEFLFSTWGDRHSRRPSSPEFDAVPWQSALRIDRSRPYAPPLSLCEKFREEKKMNPNGTRCFFSLLVADFDIDNDGRVEIVVKDMFMTGDPFYEHHSYDNYYIFPQGTVDPWQFAYGAEFMDQYQKFGSWPRILSIEVFMARPFILNGASYLSSYRRWWKNEEEHEDPKFFGVPDREYMEIYKARDELLPKTKYSPAQYEMDLICRFNMIPVVR